MNVGVLKFEFGAALEKPATVLPPAMQEAILEEMEAKKAKKHGGASKKQLEAPNGTNGTNGTSTAVAVPQSYESTDLGEPPLQHRSL